MALADRRARLLEHVAQVNDDVSAILLMEPTDIRWLTGLNSSNAVAVLSSESLVVATDNRYAGQAKGLADDFEFVVSGKVKAAAIERFAELEPGASEPVVLPNAVEQSRAVKDDDELELIGQACELSVAALEKLLLQLRIGQTEVEVARMLELEMAKLGAEDRAFPTIVATGVNSAVPHHAPTTRELSAGDFLKIDFGARIDGYNADCTRTFIVGAKPQGWQLDLHARVLGASDAAKNAVCVGYSGTELDSVAREYLRERGFGDHFLHGLGHGVGMDVHEYPFLIPNSDDVIEERSVFTIEPGLYVDGHGGVRIEDTCAMIDGKLQVLTESDRSLASVAQ